MTRKKKRDEHIREAFGYRVRIRFPRERRQGMTYVENCLWGLKYWVRNTDLKPWRDDE